VINKYLEKLETRLNSFRTFIAKFKAHDYINGVKMEFYDGKNTLSTSCLRYSYELVFGLWDVSKVHSQPFVKHKR
jgi:hypothetical protein